MLRPMKKKPTRPRMPATTTGEKKRTGRKSLSWEDDFATLFADKPPANFADLVEGSLPAKGLTEILAEKGVAPARPARPGRKKSGAPQPQEQLDLHGCTGPEAEAKTETFLTAALRKRLRAVLVVTGKGLHSPQGPVLKDLIEARLRLWKEERKILDYAWEKRSREESGALVVFLP